MIIHRPISGSLARRFAIVAAALATAALVLITASSWWLVSQQHKAAARVLHQKEAEFHASTVSRILHGVSSRLSEVAGSSILATGLVDSAGRETYLTPYLNSIQQVSGVPVQILFTDFEGKEISSNGAARFSDQHRTWLKKRLEHNRKDAAIFIADSGPELVAVEPMAYNRTQTAEGALLYKVALKDVQPFASARLLWNEEGPENPVQPTPSDVLVSIESPEIFRHLDLRLSEHERPNPSKDLAPQFAIIFVLALALSTGVFIIGSRLSLTLTRDLRQLETFSRAVVTDGFGDRRAEASGSTEVAGLARSINHMLDRLYEQHTMLQEETEKLHQLANTIPQHAWMADSDGRIHWYNDRWYEYTGMTPPQMGDWGWQLLHDPNVLPSVMANWKASIASGEPFEMSFPLRAANGQFRTFFTRAAPLRDASGKIVQWFGTNTDVTPLEEAEKAIRESQERLKEGMVAARMVVWDWDLASGQVKFSDNAQAVLGGTWDSMTSVWQAIHPDDLKLIRGAHNTAIAERGHYHQVIRVIRPDNAEVLWLDVQGKVLCDASGNPSSIRGVSVDVTERKRAEESLREADRRKDEFLAMLAHELRNPLAPISAAAQLLKLVRLDDAKVSQTSDIIARQVEHMTGLVDDLLDVSRVTRGLITLDSKPLDLKQIVSDAVEQVRPLIDARRHALALHLPPEPVRVSGDQKRLIQVISNLLNNAAKYTPEGGSIALRLDLRADRVTLTVTDTGIGISPKVLPHVFDLFIQAERSSDRSQGGLGLGLALVKSLVELHGGSVLAHSRGAGTGATFTVHLPCLTGETELPLDRERDLSLKTAQKPLRVMVVDDNSDAAQSLAMFLQAAGHDVLVESDPHRALERARVEVPEVCLLDIGLPDMDGNELARRLRSSPQTSTALLIAITGYGQEFDRKKSMAAGFDHYLVKPADTTKLVALLEERHAS
jgi:PAS domain S-box-containing protein